jgi:hypothetical protein
MQQVLYQLKSLGNGQKCKMLISQISWLSGYQATGSKFHGLSSFSGLLTQIL